MGYYANALRQFMDNPGGYESSPGYQARLDKSLEAVKRAGSSMLGSGNYLSALMDTARSGVADDYDREFARRKGLADSEQQGDLAEGQLNLQGELGRGNLGLGFYRAGNELDLGARAADNADTRAWYDYSLGSQQNNNTAAANANNYNVAQGRNAIDWYNAGTQRGSARSNDWWNQDQSQQNWRKINGPRMMF